MCHNQICTSLIIPIEDGINLDDKVCVCVSLLCSTLFYSTLKSVLETTNMQKTKLISVKTDVWSTVRREAN